jgi:O-antigen ligase
MLVLVSTITGCIFGDAKVLGFALSGYAWFLPLVFAFIITMRFLKTVAFPWMIWLPWLILLLVSVVLSPYENAVQRTAIMVSPIFVGMAVSTDAIREKELNAFLDLIKIAVIVFFIFVGVSTGMIFTGILPDITGLAAQVITGALLAALVAAQYVCVGQKRLIYYWLALAFVPFAALTRTAIVVTALTLPLTLAPLSIAKRILIIGIIATIGVGMFYTERVQKKMFHSGKGEFTDISTLNEDFRMTGRSTMWGAMKIQIDRAPWFGYGANASEAFVSYLTGGIKHPHNDWLRLQFDYGYVGTVVYGLCMLVQLCHAWKEARSAQRGARILFYAGASAFIPAAMFMYTDNIILYAAFFGNLQFTIIGMAYASVRTARMDEARTKRKTHPIYTRVRSPIPRAAL